MSRIPPAMWLVITTALVNALFIGSTVYESHMSGAIDEMAESIASNADPSIRHLSAVRSELHAANDLVDSALLGTAPLAVSRKGIEEAERTLHDELDEYMALPFYPQERALWAHAERSVADVERELNAIALRLELGDHVGADVIRAGSAAGAIQRADDALARLIALNVDQVTHLGAQILVERRHVTHVAYGLDAASFGLALLMVGFAARSAGQHVRVLEDRNRKAQEAGEAERALALKLETVAAATVRMADTISRTRELAGVLQVAIDEACAIADADFGAVGVGMDPERPFDPWVLSRLPSSTLLALGGAPRPMGVLGAVMRDARSLRLADVTRDPRFVGFPSEQVPIGPFLGVPLRDDQSVAGQMVLGRRPGRPPFSGQDERAVELLAAFADVAMRNAALYRSLEREIGAREDLLAVVSHDLRNPLSAITMAVRRMTQTMAEDDPQRRYAATVQRSATRMNRLIGDLLTAARLREGRLLVEPSPQEVSPLVAEAVDGVAAAAAEKKVQLLSQVPDGLPPAFCDHDRIVQVLSNLLGNAVKFTPSGGTITVTVTANDDIHIAVRDTGAGIAPDALPHVFDRFWQDRTPQARRGTGLGLYIAKGIVESHRGTIRATSRPGEGSEFVFTIPAAR